jgi:hypothetical protein
LKKLTPQHKRAIALLVSGKNQRSVAALLQVREETISRWKREPIFKKELSHAHSEFFREVQEKSQLASRLALDGLIYAASQRTDLASLIKACVAIMRFALRHDERRSERELLDRLNELEARLNG